MPETTPQPIEEEFLTPEESTEFTNLLMVGRLSEVVDILGFKVHIRTLSVGEDIAIGMIVKDFINTSSFDRAYKTAIVAACLVEIDGVPFNVATLSNNTSEMEILQKKFNKLKEYYPIVIDGIYARFIKLEQKLLPVVSRLGKT